MNRKYQICTKTIMDTTDSGIKFDDLGISDHYYDFQNYVKPNWNYDDLGNAELVKLISKIKKDGEGKDFDSILGLSGGVDSSYLLHKAITDWGLRPLVFHVDGGWNSELAVHNINVLINKLRVDLYTEVINWEEMKDFQLAFFKSGTPHLDIPQDHAFVATLYHFANKHGIKYILNGGNISTECVQHPLEWIYYGTDMVFINDILRKFGTVKMKSYQFSSIFFHKIYLPYFNGVKVVKPLNFIPYFKNKAISLLEKEYEWKPYTLKHGESIFTKFFEGYWLPERFGFDTRKIYLSSLILTNQMTREEALEIVSQPAYDQSKIDQEFNYIATKLGISNSELKNYFHMPKKNYKDYKNLYSIFKVGAKFVNLFGIENAKRRKK